MKERPILFSAPMVRALLAGTKTQTRRSIKENDQHNLYCGCKIICPYGNPGDRLWGKETWRTTRGRDDCKPTGLAVGAPIQYEADQWLPGHGLAEPGKTRVSIFMCRWMSRLTFEITAVRIERLQSITEADAVSEGVTAYRSPDLLTVVDSTGNTCQITPDYIYGVPKAADKWMGRTVTHVEPCPGTLLDTARDSYRTLWQKINGPGSWALNPWVWVITFRRIEP